MEKNIAIFASGSGSNAENIIKKFEATALKVKVVFCNNPNAFVISRSKKLGVPCEVFDLTAFKKEDTFLQLLEEYQVEYIVLAGFLWKVPDYLIKAFPDKVINIHPSLLPKYGGKGMFGARVHAAVVSNKETETGITIHLVNEKYDEGQIIFQAKCAVDENDNTNSVAAKIHELEYEHFPNIISEYINNPKQ